MDPHFQPASPDSSRFHNMALEPFHHKNKKHRNRKWIRNSLMPHTPTICTEQHTESRTKSPTHYKTCLTFPNLSTTSYHPILIISHNAILLTSSYHVFSSAPRLHPPIPPRGLSASAAWKRLLSSAERISAKPRRIAGMISWKAPCDVFFGPKISGCVKCIKMCDLYTLDGPLCLSVYITFRSSQLWAKK